MQLTSKFTVAVHILTAVDYFSGTETVTSAFLAGSVGANPVIVRNVMGELKAAGMLDVAQGKSGIRLAKPLSEITLRDVYRAVGCVGEEGLFHFHENPNPACPVGRNIRRALEGKLAEAQAALEDELSKTALAEIAGKVAGQTDEETDGHTDGQTAD